MLDNSKTSIVEFFDVIKIFTDNTSVNPVLKGINFRISKGELVCFMGASGAGKTTITNLILNITDITAGKIFINFPSVENRLLISGSERLTDLEIQLLHKKIAFVSQDPETNLLLNSTAEEQISFACRSRKFSKRKIQEEVSRILEYFNLIKVKNIPIKFLSGGQKQKVAIATTIVRNPDLLILDEPTSNLDGKSSRDLIKLIVKIVNERCITCIINTHSTIVAEYADHVFEIYKGNLRRSGKFNSLKNIKEEENHKSYLVIDHNGRVTIPIEFIEMLNIHDIVEARLENGKIYLTKYKKED